MRWFRMIVNLKHLFYTGNNSIFCQRCFNEREKTEIKKKTITFHWGTNLIHKQITTESFVLPFYRFWEFFMWASNTAATVNIIERSSNVSFLFLLYTTLCCCSRYFSAFFFFCFFSYFFFVHMLRGIQLVITQLSFCCCITFLLNRQTRRHTYSISASEIFR